MQSLKIKYERDRVKIEKELGILDIIFNLSSW